MIHYNNLSRKMNLDHIGNLIRPDFVAPKTKPTIEGFWNYYPKIPYHRVLSDEFMKFILSVGGFPKDGCLIFRGFPGTMLHIHDDKGDPNTAWALNLRLNDNENSYMHWFEPKTKGIERSICPGNKPLSVTNFLEFSPHEVKHIHKAKIEKASVVRIGVPHSCTNEDPIDDVVLLSVRFWFIKNQKEFEKYIEE
jgi:hypothetical protein